MTPAAGAPRPIGNQAHRVPVGTPCMLCESTSVRTVQRIRVAEIADLYQRTLGIAGVAAEFSDWQAIEFIACDQCGLRYFWPAVTGSSAFYDRLRQYDWYYSEGRSEYRFAATLVSPDAAVLDVGCGSGTLAAVVPHASYTGLEFNAGAIEAAREKGLDVLHESVEAHAARCPAVYDAVCVFQVLEHIADIRPFLNAVATCAKPGGLLIFSVPSADSFMGRATNHPLNLPPHHVTWWTDACLRSMGRLMGWEVVALHAEPLASVHRMMYLRARLLRMGWPGHRIVDGSFAFRVAARLSQMAARLVAPFMRGELERARGHSVTAVFRKPQ